MWKRKRKRKAELKVIIFIVKLHLWNQRNNTKREYYAMAIVRAELHNRVPHALPQFQQPSSSGEVNKILMIAVFFRWEKRKKESEMEKGQDEIICGSFIISIFDPNQWQSHKMCNNFLACYNNLQNWNRKDLFVDKIKIREKNSLPRFNSIWITSFWILEASRLRMQWNLFSIIICYAILNSKWKTFANPTC